MRPRTIVSKAHACRGRFDWRRLAIAGSIVMSASILQAGALHSQAQAPSAASPRTVPAAADPPEWFKGAVQDKEPGVTMPVLLKSAKPRSMAASKTRAW